MVKLHLNFQLPINFENLKTFSLLPKVLQILKVDLKNLVLSQMKKVIMVILLRYSYHLLYQILMSKMNYLKLYLYHYLASGPKLVEIYIEDIHYYCNPCTNYPNLFLWFFLYQVVSISNILRQQKYFQWFHFW